MLASQPDTPLGIRNRAMLLIGYGAALRRSELVALNIGDVVEVPQRGLKLLVRRSKSDQQGAGQEIAIWSAENPAFCPVHAWQAWMALRNGALPDGALFCGVLKNGRLTGKRLSDKAVERLVGASAAAIRLPSPERYTGHSLRAGLATAAGEEDAHLHDIMRQTRHRSVETARKYLRSRDLWKNNVTEKIFKK